MPSSRTTRIIERVTFSCEKVISIWILSNPTIYQISVVKQRRPAGPGGQGVDNREWNGRNVSKRSDYEKPFSHPKAAYSRSVKEVIQPQVPLRLPCYDLAPVTALAFGRLVPCGFRHGLRALTASMA